MTNKRCSSTHKPKAFVLSFKKPAAHRSLKVDNYTLNSQHDIHVCLQNSLIPVVMVNTGGQVMPGQKLQITSDLLEAVATGQSSLDVVYTLVPTVNNPKKGSAKSNGYTYLLQCLCSYGVIQLKFCVVVDLLQRYTMQNCLGERLTM